MEESGTCHLTLFSSTCFYIAQTELVVSFICGSVLMTILLPIGAIVAIEMLAFVARLIAEYAHHYWQKLPVLPTAGAGFLWLDQPTWYPSTQRWWAKNVFFGAKNNRS